MILFTLCRYLVESNCKASEIKYVISPGNYILGAAGNSFLRNCRVFTLVYSFDKLEEPDCGARKA